MSDRKCPSYDYVTEEWRAGRSTVGEMRAQGWECVWRRRHASAPPPAATARHLDDARAIVNAWMHECGDEADLINRIALALLASVERGAPVTGLNGGR